MIGIIIDPTILYYRPSVIYGRSCTVDLEVGEDSEALAADLELGGGTTKALAVD